MQDYRLTRYKGRFAIEWRDSAGRHRHTLGTDSRAEADRRFASFLANARASQTATVTVIQVWNGYREWLGNKPTAKTMTFLWKAIGPHFGDRSAEDLTEADSKLYVANRRAAGKSDGTIWTELARLRTALKWASDRDIINKTPKIYVPPPAGPREKRMKREQVEAFLAACEYPHVKLFCTLAISTGARMGAILGLTWDRVDFDAGTIDYRDPSRPISKKIRALTPMNGMAREALLAAKEARLTPYVIEWGGQRVGTIKAGLKAVADRVGMPWVSAHVFRHSAACILAEGGTPMSEISQMLGHKSTATTERIYARFSPEYLKKASALLDFRSGSD